MSITFQDQQREVFLSSRDRHPPNEAVRYIENNIALPGQPPPVFSERSSGFVPLEEAKQQQDKSAEIWKEVDAEKEQLFALMEKVQQKMYDNNNASTQTEMINLRRCDWREVIEEINTTAYRWKCRPNKSGKTMVFIDKVGRHSDALESWLGLLPTGDYGSSICGVFKLAIGAAGQYNKVEEVIFEALSEIPRVMESARRYLDMYQRMRDQFLEQRTIELFRAVLKLLHHIMQFFADDKSKKIIGPILKQGLYKTELMQSVEGIKTCAQAVNEEAAQCQGRMLCEVYDQNDQIQQLFQHFWHLLLTNPRLQTKGSELNHGEVESSHLRPSSYDLANIDRMTPTGDVGEIGLQSALRKGRDLVSNNDEQMARYPAEFEHANRKALRLLRHDPEALSQNINSILWLGNQLSEEMKARAAAMIRHDIFRGFMQETTSSTRLLVNGHGDIAATDGISPLSIVIAELARIVERVAGPVPIFNVKYLCGQNPVSSFVDSPALQGTAATHMMASLVSQLLCQLTDGGIVADLSFLTNAQWRKLEQLNSRVLCLMFRKLFKQLPSGSVLLCMIDEIVLYETSMHEVLTNMVLGKLVQLTENQTSEGCPVFKLLVTCHDRALDVSSHFIGHTLDLEEEVEVDDAAEWTISSLA